MTDFFFPWLLYKVRMICDIVKWCLLKIRGSSGAFAEYARADSSASCTYFGEYQNNIYSQGNTVIKHSCWKNVTGFQVEKSLSRSEVEIRNLKSNAQRNALDERK